MVNLLEGSYLIATSSSTYTEGRLPLFAKGRKGFERSAVVAGRGDAGKSFVEIKCIEVSVE